jgi:hypothetical protein
VGVDCTKEYYQSALKDLRIVHIVLWSEHRVISQCEAGARDVMFLFDLLQGCVRTGVAWYSNTIRIKEHNKRICLEIARGIFS